MGSNFFTKTINNGKKRNVSFNEPFLVDVNEDWKVLPSM